MTPEVVRVNSEILVNNGQGDGETKWKGWAWKLLLVIFVILLLKKNIKDKIFYKIIRKAIFFWIMIVIFFIALIACSIDNIQFFFKK